MSKSLAVVIPAYRVTKQIMEVLDGIGPEVDAIYVIDDGCPEGSGPLVHDQCKDPRVKVYMQGKNTGVGGAVLQGIRAALSDGANVIVKIDGDGQMDPALIPDFVEPIRSHRADYVKGNRFHGLKNLGVMPPLRIFGNTALSFLAKASTGYWKLFDPTNGYIAIDATIAKILISEHLSQRFFFETDLLARLYLLGAVVEEVPHPARYGDESSNLKPLSVLTPFLLRHLRNTIRRLFYTYFLRSFYPASFELLFGTLLLIIGTIFTGWNWLTSINTGIPRTSGTVMIASTMLIIASQCLLAFLSFDVDNYPRRPLSTRVRSQL